MGRHMHSIIPVSNTTPRLCRAHRPLLRLAALHDPLVNRQATRPPALPIMTTSAYPPHLLLPLSSTSGARRDRPALLSPFLSLPPTTRSNLFPLPPPRVSRWRLLDIRSRSAILLNYSWSRLRPGRHFAPRFALPVWIMSPPDRLQEVSPEVFSSAPPTPDRTSRTPSSA